MPNRELSQESCWSLCRQCCFRQRVMDSFCGFVFLGLSIYCTVVYFSSDAASIANTWKEYGPFLILGFLAVSIFWFIMAYFKSPVSWVRGEPEDSEIVLICMKRCFRCSQEPSASTTVVQARSRLDPDTISTNSTYINRSITSIIHSLHRASMRQARLEEANAELNDSSIWECIKCIWCRNSSDQEALPSTTENLAQSSTDPTRTSSRTENMEMIELSPEQQVLLSSQQVQADGTNSSDQEASSAPKNLTRFRSDSNDKSLTKEDVEIVLNLEQQVQADVTNSADSGELTGIKKRISRQYSDALEPTEELD